MKTQENAVTRTAMQIGWLSAAFMAMGTARIWAHPLSSKTTIIPVQGNPIYTKAATPDELLASAKLAAQGTAKKDIQVAIIADPPVDTTLTGAAAGASACFGILLKLASSVLSFKPGIFRFNFLDAAVPLTQVWVKPQTNILEFIWLGTLDAGGQASVVKVVQPVVTVVAASSSLTAGDSFSMETLNERDLQKLQK